MQTIVRALFFYASLATAVPVIVSAATVEDELNQLEESRYAALIAGDWQALDALLADEFFYNTGTGASLTKSAFIEYMKSGAAVVKKAVREDSRVRVYGDAALVTGIAHVDVTVKGEEKTLHSRYLHVWTRQNQSWKLVARQATYLPEKK
jgi:ketosteroid isomerase-like protein